MKQFVKEATHIDGNLLDLVLSSLPFATKCSVTPCIADHNGVLTKIDVPVLTETTHQREVWVFKRADWDKLQRCLERHDWSILDSDPVNDAASYMVEVILSYCRLCIPMKVCVEVRKSDPWMTKRCEDALVEKAAFENTDGYADACRRCGDVIRAEFSKYVDELKVKLNDLPRCSKDW